MTRYVFRRAFVSRASCSPSIKPRFLVDLRSIVLPPATSNLSSSTFPSTASSHLCNMLFARDLFKKPTLFSPLRKYSINAITTSSHSPRSFGSQKSYNLVDDNMILLSLTCSSYLVSWICLRYAGGNVAWYNWNEVCVIKMAKAYR